MSFRHIPLCCRISHLDLQAALGSPCIFFRLVRSVREPCSFYWRMVKAGKSGALGVGLLLGCPCGRHSEETDVSVLTHTRSVCPPVYV